MLSIHNGKKKKSRTVSIPENIVQELYMLVATHKRDLLK